MGVSLNTAKIAEIGNKIITMLHESGVDTVSQLTINVDSHTLRKIDEDLYYRRNPNGEDFVPSENFLTVNIGPIEGETRLQITIQADA